jgi:hypothetical protein
MITPPMTTAPPISRDRVQAWPVRIVGVVVKTVMRLRRTPAPPAGRTVRNLF